MYKVDKIIAIWNKLAILEIYPVDPLHIIKYATLNKHSCIAVLLKSYFHLKLSGTVDINKRIDILDIYIFKLDYIFIQISNYVLYNILIKY